jgi:hypothetical protein
VAYPNAAIAVGSMLVPISMYAHHIAPPPPTMMSVYAYSASFAAWKRIENNLMNWIAGFRRSSK